ncbi:monofunctional biosynthetic peptidoglycan transglycosylase [Rhodoferax koreense]|uniref:Biosynthetic peptidoglycan transglycosylase n=1 Tax=Rhodoferax koreensis TaxID=1842727 RepID=A0A1P8K150_9BURK|nr:monofunctional biosynthetic peptidoglycan transglycosylase [Rhodoferax koreense]APW39727.1 monofunctional biosynthetic peptidoglycan transglycosylase [Rhodoferax koreense]
MRTFWRWIALLLMSGLALELFFLGRIAAMAVIDPQSTAFQRSEAWRLATEGPTVAKPAGKAPAKADTGFRWAQRWLPYAEISDNLKRAVIASEDGGFVNHEGVDWEALDKAWQKNEKAQEQAAKFSAAAKPGARAPKIVGGSTITQQLAKNLLLSGERTLLRKGQEFVLTMMLELVLSKQRILEIYLNSVEWGEGVFGAEAAAQHYFRKPASRLSAYEGARLAVMLPRPKYFEKVPNSGYLSHRASVIVARSGDVELP